MSAGFKETHGTICSHGKSTRVLGCTATITAIKRVCRILVARQRAHILMLCYVARGWRVCVCVCGCYALGLWFCRKLCDELGNITPCAVSRCVGSANANTKPPSTVAQPQEPHQDFIYHHRALPLRPREFLRRCARRH